MQTYIPPVCYPCCILSLQRGAQVCQFARTGWRPSVRQAPPSLHAAFKGMPLQLFFVDCHVLSDHATPGPWPAYLVPSFFSWLLRNRSLTCFYFKTLTTGLASLLAKVLFPCLVRWIPSLPRNCGISKMVPWL